jgi:rhamnulokinase
VKNYLIYDFGASNGRASVGSFDGRKFSIEVVHRFDNIPVFVTGTLYWDILRLFSELKTGLVTASRKFEQLVSLGIDTWGVDFGLIDKNGKLISNPVHYRDKKRNNITGDVFKIIPEKEIFDITGNPVVSYYSIFNLYHLKESGSVEYSNAAGFLMTPDLFNYFLTGVAVNEYTIAHTTALCNPIIGNWDDSIIDRLGFPRGIFCDIIQPGTVVGPLLNSISDELDVRSVKVVAPVCHDTPSAILGIPLIEKNKNTVMISIGTWGITIFETDLPVINDEVYSSGFANEAGAGGKNLLFRNFVGMWLIQQCRNSWKIEEGRDISFDEIMNSARQSAPVDSFINLDDPDFILNQNDMPKAIAGFCKKTGQNIPSGMPRIARVIYESLALRIRNDIETLEKILNKKIKSLHIAGGGTKDGLFCQWASDAAGMTVFAGPTETSSIGNLLMQLKADGEINGIEEGRQISFDSSDVKTYQPQNSSYWDGQYSRYLKKIV